MVQLLVGKKGSGKTKALINEVNKASSESNGAVVCLEYGKSLTFDISSRARLVDALEYDISDAKSLYGFVCGMLAANYDVTHIFIDNSLKLCGGDKQQFVYFAQAINNVAKSNSVVCVISASMEAEELPEELRRLIRTNE